MVNLSENDIICPFCCVQIREINNKNNQITHCCKRKLNEIDYQFLCKICGKIYYEFFKNNYIDSYENMYKIRKKSIYIRKYHIQNLLSDIKLKNKLSISRYTINRVCQIFDLINMVLPQVNKDRRRIISIKFIIHKLFEKWNLKFDIPITKSKKTLHNYIKYWDKLCLLIEV